MAHNDSPLVIARDGKLTIAPRHIDEEAIDYALEYAEWAHDDDHKREIARGGRIADAIENEQLQRWDLFVEQVSPTFSSRAAAVEFAVRFVAQIDQTWPQA